MKRAAAFILSIVLLLLISGCHERQMNPGGWIGENRPTIAANQPPEKTTASEIVTEPTTVPEPTETLVSDKTAEKMIDLVKEVKKFEKKGVTQAKMVEYLSGYEWITNVSKTPDGGVCCRTEFGVTGVWNPESEDTIGAKAQSNSGSTKSTGENVDVNVHDVKSIAVLCPYASVDSNFKIEEYTELAETMEKYTGCTFTFYEDEEVSLQLLRNLDVYDMVWFYSHGTLSCVFNSAWDILYSEPYTMTGEFADSPAAYVFLSEDFFYERTVIDLSDGRIGVGGDFYKHYYTSNELDGMFFHFASCYSMKTESLANGILSRGAAWVQGWSDSVYFENDYGQFSQVVDELVAGKDVIDAIAKADSKEKSKDYYQKDCLLKGKGLEEY